MRRVAHFAHMRPPLLLAAAALVVAPALHAQAGARANLDWRTLETPHFVFHYPTLYAAWARYAAERMEAAQPAVERLVGFAPPERVTVVVENPSNDANGSTYPFVNASSIVLWPTPPSPRSDIGHTRGFTEELTTHEYAHAAHLARPSRNGRERFVTALLPIGVGPLLRRTPRWAIEGYATYVEGRLTGSGRPHGVARAAALRALALEGRLPSYAQMSSGGSFLGGSMAYLAGSAYLEWLADRGGDSSLVHVWRRLSARQPRTFDAAFAGVFGEAPATLYDRFRAELTADAIAIERARGGAALPAAVGGAAASADSVRLEAVRGRLVQRLASYVGDPAASRDGKLLALTTSGPSGPTTVLVMSTTRDTVTAAERRARRRAQALDPEDVPAIEHFPRPLRVLSRLPAVNGFSFGQPRFFADGRRVLVARAVPRSDGTTRPQLFVWDRDRGTVRQITHGPGTSGGDPSPDGRSAAAVRCEAARCDLVIVDLATGDERTLAAGSFDAPYYRPRFSPDGRTIAVSVQGGGRWRPVLVSVATGAVREVAPADAASRYEPTFTPDGRALVVTSEAGGVADLERIDLATGATTRLTAVTGAAAAPEPAADGRGVYFLSLYAGGYDLRLTRSDSAPSIVIAPPNDTTRSLAARVPDTTVAPLVLRSAGAERAYGLGPRRTSVLPGGAFGASTGSVVLAIANTDPIGRFAATLQGAYGDRAAWRGAALAARLTRFRPAIEASAFHLEQRASREPEASAASPSLDANYSGALASVELRGDWRARSLVARVGGSAGELRPTGSASGTRTFGFAELGGGAALLRGRRGALVGARTALSSGSTAGASWSRGLAAASLELRGVPGPPLALEGSIGAVGRDAPVYEQFAVGGLASPITTGSLLPQRITMPVLPTGTLVGSRFASYRVSTPFAGARAYLWGASAGDRIGRGWRQVAGLEVTASQGDLWLLRLPRVTALLGAGIPLQRELGRRVRAYGSLTWRP